MITMKRLFQNNPVFDEDAIKRNQHEFDYLHGVVDGAMKSFPENPYKRVAEVMAQPKSTIARDVLVWFFSWAIPNGEAIEELVKHSPIIEIAAGRGYWAKLVKNAGGKIRCFDSLEDNPNLELQWTPVEQGSFSQVCNRPDHTLFMCWPPYDNPLAFNTLKLYEGKTFIYVGEGEGGCNGDDEFHQLLDRDWKETKTIEIPQWWGIHDYMVVYNRK